MKKVLIAISLFSIFISCGPNAEQKAAIEKEVIQKMKAEEDSMAAIKSHEDAITAAQHKHDDSIANAVAAQYQQKEAKQNNKETLNRMQNQYNTLEKMLIDDDGKLTVLNDRKNRDAQFHLGRTQSQREQWLKNDQRDIDNLKLQMINIKNQMENLKMLAQKYK